MNIQKKSYCKLSNIIMITFLILVSSLALYLRILFIPTISGDYIYYLLPWFNQIKSSGGVLALSKPIGNYNFPYLYILSLLTYVPLNSLVSIKSVSILFDFIGAVSGALIVMEILRDNHKKHLYGILTYSIILFIPTVFLNSSAWGQCDFIYCTFILISLYFLIRNNNILSFIFLGLAFSFKLQTVFVFPVYFIYAVLKNKKLLLNFLFIPIVNLVLAIPILILGLPFKNIYMVYIDQIRKYSELSMNFPNLYVIVFDNSYIKFWGYAFTLILFIYIFMQCRDDKDILSNENILALSALSVIICTYFLPHMHDRYMFLADVLITICCIINLKYLIISLDVIIISLLTYTRYLYRFSFINIQIAALIHFVAMIYLIKILFVYRKKSIKQSSIDCN